jgi:hypothetical protein
MARQSLAGRPPRRRCWTATISYARTKVRPFSFLGHHSLTPKLLTQSVAASTPSKSRVFPFARVMATFTVCEATGALVPGVHTRPMESRPSMRSSAASSGSSRLTPYTKRSACLRSGTRRESRRADCAGSDEHLGEDSARRSRCDAVFRNQVLTTASIVTLSPTGRWRSRQLPRRVPAVVNRVRQLGRLRRFQRGRRRT